MLKSSGRFKKGNKMETVEQKLSGGHHNSLGRVEEVVEDILEGRTKLDELYQTYFSEDEVVRLRVSSCMKRISIHKPEMLAPYIEKLLGEITRIDQASTQWTLSILFDNLKSFMSPDQLERAREHMKFNLENHKDWIVLNTTMQVLFDWSKNDAELKTWIIPRLEVLQNETRKSVANRAKKLIKKLSG
jgi:hypothetical protein